MGRVCDRLSSVSHCERRQRMVGNKLCVPCPRIHAPFDSDADFSIFSFSLEISVSRRANNRGVQSFDARSPDVFRAVLSIDVPVNRRPPLIVIFRSECRARVTTLAVPMTGHRPANPSAAQSGTSSEAAVKLDAHYCG